SFGVSRFRGLHTMFGFERQRQEEIFTGLIGATRALDRAVVQLFNQIDPSAPQDPLKLSYYSMAAVAYAFFMYSKQPDDKKIEILDAYASRLISKFPEYHKQAFDPVSHSTARLIRDYQNAHRSYSDLLHKIFAQAKSDSAITMMMVLWQTVTGKSAQGKMIELSAYSAMLVEFTGEAF